MVANSEVDQEVANAGSLAPQDLGFLREVLPE